MTWERLAYKEIEGSATSTIDTGDFSAKGYRNTLKIIIHIKDDGANANCTLQCNSFTGAGYSYKYSENGDFTDGTGNINKNQIRLYKTGSGTDVIRDMTLTISNVLNRVKIMYGHIMESTGTGSNSNTLDRIEVAAGWEENPRIKSFQVKNTGSNNFAVGSYIVVYGSTDGEAITETIDEKDNLTNVPANTRYEETNTRKIYRKNANYTAVTYSTDFSSNTGWTEVGTGNLTIDTSNSRMQYNADHSGDDDALVYDLGAGNVSDTAWVLRYKFNMSGSNAPSQYMMPMLSSESVAGSSNTTIDALGMWFGETGSGTGGAYANIRLSDGETSQGGSYHGNTSSTFSNSTDYYITMKRESATKFTIEVRTGSHTGSHALGSPISATDVPSSVGGLRYICFRDNDGSTHTRYLNSYIYDLEFYNGATSVDTDEWKERGSA